MPKKPFTELTGAEWLIMNVVWEIQPCPAPTVQEALVASRNWSYSTVRTLMDRLVVKGVLKAERLRNLTLYRAAITRKQAQKQELASSMKKAFNGALTPMFECLFDAKSVTPEELAAIEKLVKARRKRKE